jgi:ribonuclease R
MAKSLPSRTDILQVLASEDRAFHAKELATRLGVDAHGYQGLLRQLDDITLEGLATARDGHKFKLSRSSAGARGEEREGVLSINPRGFGFVAALGAAGDDVFVPPESIGGAMHSDRVVVRIRARGSRGAEGEIVRVTLRGIKRVAGVLRRRGKSAWLEPDDTRIRAPIPLPDDIDAKSDGNSGKDGDAAVISITRYPELVGEQPVGKLEAVLGKPGELKVEVAKILVREQVEETHMDAAFAEADAYGKEVPADMITGRRDLTHLPLPTIDPEDARDHDDAVWVERTEDGGYVAWVAIADVSSYVRPGTMLDVEAKSRGCSVYLPDRAIPMLPRPLSSNLCSLLPDVVRLCLCAEIVIDAGGEVRRTEIHRGFMKSQAKLTYGGVARALGFTDKPAREPEAERLRDGLRVAYELSRILRTRRMKRGALDFELPEPKVVLDEQGNLVDIQRRAQDEGTKKAYQLIEELMLLANEVVARWLSGQQIPTVYRIHAPPDQEKLVKFATMCESLGIQYDLELLSDPKELSALLKSFTGHPSANVLNMLLLRSMKQATYDIGNIGHFGLASKAYLHFTSPIRRYPDLLVHRAVHRVLLGERIERDTAAVQLLAESAMQSSVNERKVMEIEREVVDLYRAILMRDKVGEKYEGGVTGLVGSGVFVALDAPFVDVLVRLEDLGSDRYELDDDGLRVVAGRSGDSIQLGDRMSVEICDVAILRRTVYARRIGGADEGKGPKRRTPRTRPGTQLQAPGKGKKGDRRDTRGTPARPQGKKKGPPGRGKRRGR